MKFILEDSYLFSGLKCLCFIVSAFLYSPLQSGVFDTLSVVDQKDRIDIVRTIMIEKIMRMDSLNAFKAFEELEAFAIKERDKDLQVMALVHKGDYYNKFKETKKQAIYWMNEGLKLAESFKLELRASLIIYRIGIVYYDLQNYPLAFEYLLKSDKMMREIGYENIPDVSSKLAGIGWVYSDFRNYNKGMAFYKKSIEYASENSRLKSAVYNNLGLNFRELMQLDSAINCYQKALKLAILNNDSLTIGISKANIGDLLLLKGKYKDAKPYLEEGYLLCKSQKDWTGVGRILMTIIDIDIYEDNISQAKKRIEETRELIENGKTTDELILLEFIKAKSKIYRKENKLDLAYIYLDSFMTVKDSLYKQKDLNMLSNLEAQQLTDKHLTELQLLEKERRVQQVIKNSIISLSALLALFFLFIIVNIRTRQKRKQKILELEKEKAEKELLNAEKDLKVHLNSIKEKNKLLEQFKKEIKELRNNTNDKDDPELKKTIENLTNATILTDDEWLNFKRMFEAVHKGFFHRLALKHPDLTVSEIRLLALIKLDLSNLEIASMVGISLYSVGKTSLRLRKKLNITAHNELIEFVENI